jgi:predicted O-methyltransferase YrrM
MTEELSMATEFRAPDWQEYKMDFRDPHRELEPLKDEVRVVDEALAMLVAEGILPHTGYDGARLLAHREAVRAQFEIPWTAISPRMQRLLYAINAIKQPRNVIAAGVFCGNTFISNAGAGVGPGACYTAEALIGVEIKPEEAERAERNVRKIDPTGVARVLAADALDIVAEFGGPIDVLYLDANGDKGRGKGIYLEILQAAYGKLPAGAVVLAHNSVNGGEQVQAYLDWVRDPANMRASVNVIVDPEGLEVSAK